MKIEEALKLAKNHLDKMNQKNLPDNGIKWIVSEPKEVQEGWYFDYEFESINPDEEIYMAGAPGFIIKKESGLIEDVSWQSYQSFQFEA